MTPLEVLSIKILLKIFIRPVTGTYRFKSQPLVMQAYILKKQTSNRV